MSSTQLIVLCILKCAYMFRLSLWSS